ncbi:MAG: hypothetical protein WKF37_11270 [Bryobacteraceae bacterium]
MNRPNLLLTLVLVSATAASRLPAQTYPKAEIRNGLLTAELYLPDAQKGYYRGTRFDWSGVIRSLKYRGHEFFGEWFEKHDPLVHDAITGPVDVFDPTGAGLGYQEAKPGDSFLRIGVGLLEKPDESAFRSSYTYKLVDSGKWTVTKGNNWIEFVQTVPNRTGYAYLYRKRITFIPDKPEMVIAYTLKNTGRKVIDTTLFNHNFFVIDSQKSGPGIVARFPFEPRAVDDLDGMIETRGRELFFEELEGQQRSVRTRRFRSYGKRLRYRH